MARQLISDYLSWQERQPRGTQSQRLRAYAEKLLSVPGDFSPAGVPSAPTFKVKSQDDIPIEPLSHRELEILHLLPSELSVTEIAQTLFVSVHTVRSHIKAIYSKLDAHTRYEAIARAQMLGLL